MDEIARMTALKAALVQTTTTPGFDYIRQLAEKIVFKATNAALDEEDAAKRNDKVLKASALRRGFAELFNTIDQMKQFNPQEDFSEEFNGFDN